MAIDILSDRTMRTMPETGANRLTGAERARTAAVGKAAQTGDSTEVEFTAQAQTLSRAAQKAAASDGMDHAKIEALRQSLADGTYSVNYESVANKIIDTEDELSSIF